MNGSSLITASNHGLPCPSSSTRSLIILLLRTSHCALPPPSRFPVEYLTEKRIASPQIFITSDCEKLKTIADATHRIETGKTGNAVRIKYSSSITKTISHLFFIAAILCSIFVNKSIYCQYFSSRIFIPETKNHTIRTIQSIKHSTDAFRSNFFINFFLLKHITDIRV